MSGIVIIGGGMAGARACINLRVQGYQGGITLVSEEVHLPYDRPPLSKSSITAVEEPLPVWLLEPDIVASLKVNTILGVGVSAIGPANHRVVLADGRLVSYDKLLIATGAKPRSLGPNAVTLRDHADAISLRAKFQPGAKVVVIGGGFIGLELASAARKRGAEVTLLEAQPRILMRGVPERIARIVHDRHVSEGVAVETGTAITAVGANSVTLADGRNFAADVIVAGIGAAPEVRLAQQAGLTIENGIACDAFMQTSDPDIYAAGDCCSFPNALFGNRRIRLEAWRSAQEQSATAVENLLGGKKMHRAVPWFWSDQYDLSLQIAGMADMGPITVERDMGNGALLLFHLAADGRLMGASGIGPGNSIARDIKLAEMMIAKEMRPAPEALADSRESLKGLLKA